MIQPNLQRTINFQQKCSTRFYDMSFQFKVNILCYKLSGSTEYLKVVKNMVHFYHRSVFSFLFVFASAQPLVDKIKVG